MTTIARILLLNSLFIGLLAAATEFLFPKDAEARTPIAILETTFPGNETNNPDRPVKFVVPDRDTSVSASGGHLTRHEVHLSKLVEITHYYWCQNRPSQSGLYIDYSANNGKEFRGRFYITCQFAAETIDRFGIGASEQTELTANGRLYQLDLPTLNPSNLKDFKNRIDDLKPSCIGPLTQQICPGDRITPSAR